MPDPANHNGMNSLPQRSLRQPATWIQRACLLGAILLAILHIMHPWLLSGGGLMPGNHGDTRFNMAVLEHHVQVLRGHYAAFTTAQSYPLQHNLFYSDTHWGTAPLYIAFRLVGLSMETSFACWLMGIIALNAWALSRLLQLFRLPALIQYPLVAVGAASSLYVHTISMGHPQVILIFPFVCAFRSLLLFLKTARPRYLGQAAMWMAYQALVYLYHAYLGCLLLGAVATLGLAYRLTRGPFRRRLLPALLRDTRSLALAALVTTVLGALVLGPYLCWGSGTSRGESNLLFFAPDWRAWLDHQPGNLLASWLGLPEGDHATLPEKRLLLGWTLWTTTFLALATSLFTRRRQLWVPLILTLAAAGVIVFVTKWNEGGPYYRLMKLIPPMTAFRAYGRISLLLIPVLLTGAGVFLASAWRSRWLVVRIACCILLAGIVTENVTRVRLTYDIAAARDRVLGVIAEWRKAGDRPVLAFVPGLSNQYKAEVRMDAWLAALALHRFTLNGLSLDLDDEYSQLYHQPTRSHAEALLRRFDLAKDKVSFVDSWSEDVMARQPIRNQSGLEKLRLFTLTSNVVMRAGHIRQLPVFIENPTPYHQIPFEYFINASYRIRTADDPALHDWGSMRTTLRWTPPSSTNAMEQHIQAPGQPGRYKLHLALVMEGVYWSDQMGMPASIVDLEVLP